MFDSSALIIAPTAGCTQKLLMLIKIRAAFFSRERNHYQLLLRDELGLEAAIVRY